MAFTASAFILFLSRDFNNYLLFADARLYRVPSSILYLIPNLCYIDGLQISCISIHMKYIILLTIIVACTTSETKDEDEESAAKRKPAYPAQTDHLSKKQLAIAFCGNCHLFPQPDLLTKKLWKDNVLPEMGLRLGIRKGKNPFQGMSYYEMFRLNKANVFPIEPQISEEAWQQIEDYYMAEAPDTILEMKNKVSTSIGLKQFTPKIPDFNKDIVPLITLLAFDSLQNNLYVGDGTNELKVVNHEGEIQTILSVYSPPSYLYSNNNDLFVLTMGVMHPNDESLGKLAGTPIPLKGTNQNFHIFLDSLSRPVHAAFADLNQDKREDVVICNFGNYVGHLSWYENLGNARFRQHILRGLPGAIKSYVHDFNKDGLHDIIALMGQGDEGIFIYYNQGEGIFKEQEVKRFHPLYGSSHLELIDFNRDGWMDLLYTNGDNADYSFSLKGYHGIRLFLNDSHNQFEEAYFYPLHGATKAIGRDFDQDGDLDIAAIAFFPDYRHAPHESFVFLENQGNLNFAPYTFQEAVDGRWLVMECGDFDQDGDKDIALGSFIFGVTPVPDHLEKRWQELQHNVIILENTLY